MIKNKRFLTFAIHSFLLSLLGLSPAAFAKKEPVHLVISGYGDPAALFYTHDNFLSCRDLNQLISPHENRRDFIDLLILCKAFDQTKLEVDFEMVKASGYSRAIRISKNGIADMPAETIWNEDIDRDRFYMSLPIIKSGQYQKGIYTLATHPLQNANPLQTDFSKYSAVTVKNWDYDIQALSDLTLHITESYSFNHLFYMLNAKRADLTLMSFTALPNMAHYLDDVTLLPIKGVKVAFKSSRHFIVSKKISPCEKNHRGTK